MASLYPWNVETVDYDVIASDLRDLAESFGFEVQFFVGDPEPRPWWKFW